MKPHGQASDTFLIYPLLIYFVNQAQGVIRILFLKSLPLGGIPRAESFLAFIHEQARGVLRGRIKK